MSPATHAGNSLRRRLMLLLTSGLVLIWLLAATLTAVKTRHEVDELLDAHLVQSASLLLAQVSADTDEIDTEHAPTLNRYSYKLAFQVWQGEQLRLHSVNAPAQALGTQTQGFSTNTVAGKTWRTFTASSADRQYRVRIAEAQSVRKNLAQDMFLQLLSPLLLALPLLALLVWFVVDRTLQPLTALSASIARQHAGNLHAVTLPVPTELAPLVGRLNALLERVADSYENERRFTSDAAHELRTPLAAVHTQLQVAQGATNAEERSRAIAMALAAGERASRLLQQLLTLARLDQKSSQQQATAVSLRDIVSNAFELIASEAATHDITLAFETDNEADVVIKGHRDLLLILLRNLLDNAIRYSPAHTTVTISARKMADSIVLAINDEGPGIAPENRAAALQRFKRLDESGRHGSGLGLSIVERIAALHNTSLVLHKGKNSIGLCAEIRFPC